MCDSLEGTHQRRGKAFLPSPDHRSLALPLTAWAYTVPVPPPGHSGLVLYHLLCPVTDPVPPCESCQTPGKSPGVPFPLQVICDFKTGGTKMQKSKEWLMPPPGTVPGGRGSVLSGLTARQVWGYGWAGGLHTLVSRTLLGQSMKEMCRCRKGAPTSDHQSLRQESVHRVLLCVTPWTVAHQASLSMEFSWQEYWSR